MIIPHRKNRRRVSNIKFSEPTHSGKNYGDIKRMCDERDTEVHRQGIFTNCDLEISITMPENLFCGIYSDR